MFCSVFCKRVISSRKAILCSKNDNADAINSKVMENVFGEKVILYSADTVQSDLTNTEAQAYPSEYLQTLSPSGLPPAVLGLKVGLPVMLLRNFNPERSLCNGTRLIMQQIGQYVLKVKILGGSDAVELIPRFTLSTLPGTLPFILTRKQFPVKVSFAMTINKSQGQSLKKVAVDLRSPVFTHSQLYVAMSRATSANDMTILLPENIAHAQNGDADIERSQIDRLVLENYEKNVVVAKIKSPSLKSYLWFQVSIW
ncbi:inositol hexakisphosphate and diphosphoinositol-pentakisphosphate kinase [Mucor velutinosus]|uniref:Inositol hexakisphosphate and diphosphoinositol-pentakisphosphate kinase n=1 Tax=Mucor velutinosus TaxID=708070 RepID=A0AAN7D9N5_9FUNG|nr:inositol hexakisphosphate and diphosphoinositol-pentakisphosphate kinase [Mucor velutinosus]